MKWAAEKKRGDGWVEIGDTINDDAISANLALNGHASCPIRNGPGSVNIRHPADRWNIDSLISTKYVQLFAQKPLLPRRVIVIHWRCIIEKARRGCPVLPVLNGVIRIRKQAGNG